MASPTEDQPARDSRAAALWHSDASPERYNAHMVRALVIAETKRASIVYVKNDGHDVEKDTCGK